MVDHLLPTYRSLQSARFYTQNTLLIFLSLSHELPKTEEKINVLSVITSPQGRAIAGGRSGDDLSASPPTGSFGVSADTRGGGKDGDLFLGCGRPGGREEGGGRGQDALAHFGGFLN